MSFSDDPRDRNWLFILSISRPAKPPRLSRLERRVLRLWSLGRSTRQIATALGHTPAMISRRLEGIRRKLGIRHPALLTRWAMALGITTLCDRLDRMDQALSKKKNQTRNRSY